MTPEHEDASDRTQRSLRSYGFDVNLPSDVLERLGVEPTALVPLAGGDRGMTFRSRDLVVRIECVPPGEIEWQYALIRLLAAAVPEVITPLAVEGSVSVWPFVPGRHARRNDRNDALAAADLLRRLHEAGRAWNGGQRPGARPAAGDGDRGPTHGDFYGRNIIVRKDAIAAIVDWDESSIDLLDYELANAIWEFCKSKRTHDFDRALAREMMRAYGSPQEPDDLISLIVARRRIEMTQTNDRAYRHHTARAIENLSAAAR
jgi:Ser/Thr protein kinase RdoA (MazF antagonist)